MNKKKERENKQADYSKRENKSSKYSKKGSKSSKYSTKKPGITKRNRPLKGEPMPKFDSKIRLNKFISNAGICSRREADVLIESGVVSVNGEVITEMGYKMNRTDTVKYDGMTVQLEKKRYFLVNKPKGYNSKPSKKHKSVYLFLSKACKEVLFPVGKMDKDMSGLIIYTNDDDFNKKLSHHKFKASQLFHVILNKEMDSEDMETLKKGMFVDKEMFSVNEVNYVTNKPKTEIGVHLFSHKSYILQVMLEKLGYQVVNYDRVEFASLTKKDLPRGHYRNLTDREIAFLKKS